MKQVIVLLSTVILGLSLAGTVLGFGGTVDPIAESVNGMISTQVTTSALGN